MRRIWASVLCLSQRLCPSSYAPSSLPLWPAFCPDQRHLFPRRREESLQLSPKLKQTRRDHATALLRHGCALFRNLQRHRAGDPGSSARGFEAVTACPGPSLPPARSRQSSLAWHRMCLTRYYFLAFAPTVFNCFLWVCLLSSSGVSSMQAGTVSKHLWDSPVVNVHSPKISFWKNEWTPPV